MTYYHMKRFFKPWHLFAITLVLVATTLFTMTSCGDDEPDATVVDYYVNVEEQFLITGSTDKTDRYENPVTRMRNAIHKAYPSPDNKGNDEAVLAACEQEYQTYKQLYLGYADHFTCLFHIVRAVKQGNEVKENVTLLTYVYDINSTVTDVEQ
jgi:hypothetical protein